MASLPNKKYGEWLRSRAAAKDTYWLGCCFEKCTEELLERKIRQYPNDYTPQRIAWCKEDIKKGKMCADCIGGAIKGAAWTLLGTQEKSKGRLGCKDHGVRGMYDACVKEGMAHGTMDTFPDIPGIALTMDGHVGVSVGNGEAVEWKGFGVGCKLTKIKGRGWVYWYKLPWVTYAEDSKQDTPNEPSKSEKEKVSTKKITKGECATLYRPTGGAVIGTIKINTTCTYYGEKNGYYAVKSGNLKGFVKKEYCGAPSNGKVKIINGDACKVYNNSKPDAAIGSIAVGTSCDIYGEKNGFYAIKTKNIKGYIKKEDFA